MIKIHGRSFNMRSCSYSRFFYKEITAYGCDMGTQSMSSSDSRSSTSSRCGSSVRVYANRSERKVIRSRYLRTIISTCRKDRSR